MITKIGDFVGTKAREWFMPEFHKLDPVYQKAICIGLALAYFLCPIDLSLFDFPVIGHIDDASVALSALFFALRPGGVKPPVVESVTVED